MFKFNHRKDRQRSFFYIHCNFHLTANFSPITTVTDVLRINLRFDIEWGAKVGNIELSSEIWLISVRDVVGRWWDFAFLFYLLESFTLATWLPEAKALIPKQKRNVFCFNSTTVNLIYALQWSSDVLIGDPLCVMNGHVALNPQISQFIQNYFLYMNFSGSDFTQCWLYNEPTRVSSSTPLIRSSFST